jgi:hypothetical protein
MAPSETHAKMGPLGMTSVKPFEILDEGIGGGGAMGRRYHWVETKTHRQECRCHTGN